MPTAILDDRALVSVSGPDAGHLLQTIVTADLDQLGAGDLRPCALLTPQGKILFDFLVSRAGDDAFLLDCRSEVADDLARRLTLYRLRAKAEISKLSQTLVRVAWGDDSARSHVETGYVRDARFKQHSVYRSYESAPPPLIPPHTGEGDSATSTPPSPLWGGVGGGGSPILEAWHAFRISQGVAESGDDYALGDAFPHDVLLDQNGGVGFRKGCYVGQEVVSRMQHRGTARRRILIASGETTLPPPGTDIEAGGRNIGTLGSVSERSGLALVRIDKAKAAMDAGVPILVGGVAVTLAIPEWAGFAFPQDLASAGEA